jgi:glycosyltransferase involved in cell wall biosynthesis
MKIVKYLFLSSELSDYFNVCLQCLGNQKSTEVHVIHMPVNIDAPFDFSNINQIYFYPKSSLRKLFRLASEINPDIIILMGWNDFNYNIILLRYYRKIKVLCMDNRWIGSTKQKFASCAGKMFLYKLFDYIFIPGAPQKEYAFRLGFSEKQILKGCYSANLSLFKKYYEKTISEKKKEFPHRLLFVGRYTEVKMISELVSTFIEIQNQSISDWELWCLGTGPLLRDMPENRRIKHFGFVQPCELEKIIQNTGVFILPSSFEPWGVVVHEFAAAGFPLICSDKIGAASEFLEDGINGFSYRWNDKESLKQVLQRVMTMSKDSLIKMCERSVLLSNRISPEKWSNTLYDLRNEK